MNLFVATIGYALATAAVIGLASASFTLQYAVSGIINLATGEFLTVGAYLTYAGTHYLHLNVWLAGVMAILETGILATALNHFLVAPLMKRGTNTYGIMVITLGISIVVQNLLIVIFSPNTFSLGFGGQSRAISIGAFNLTSAQVITIVVGVVAMIGLEFGLHRSLRGRAIRATVDSPILARACGIRTAAITDAAWFVSGCFGAIAGLALAISTSSVDSQIGYTYLLYFMPAAFFGGLGSIFGAMIGSVVIAFATSMSTLVVGTQYQNVVSLVILLIVVMIRPTGIIRPIRAEVAAS